MPLFITMSAFGTTKQRDEKQWCMGTYSYTMKN